MKKRMRSLLAQLQRKPWWYLPERKPQE